MPIFHRFLCVHKHILCVRMYTYSYRIKIYATLILQANIKKDRRRKTTLGKSKKTNSILVIHLYYIFHSNVYTHTHRIDKLYKHLIFYCEMCNLNIVFSIYFLFISFPFHWCDSHTIYNVFRDGWIRLMMLCYILSLCIH